MACDSVAEEITDALGVSNPLVISSKTGYGIHNLKTIMADHMISMRSAEDVLVY